MGDKDVDEDLIDDDLDDEDDDSDDDRPTFVLEDLKRDRKFQGSRIVIEEMTIPDLEQVVVFANDCARPISIEESVIEKARIRTADIPITMDGADIFGHVDCNQGNFNKEIQFWDVSFDGDVSFKEAVFRASVSFKDCLFQGDTDFSACLFEKNVSFVSCDFEKETSFDGTRFQARVDFRNSVFKKRVQLKNTSFAQAVDLNVVRFVAGCDTTGSNLEEVSKAKVKGTEKKTAHIRPSQGNVKQERKTFNPWVELDRVSKKQMSRRDLFRGIRNLIPKRDDTG